MPNPHSEHLHLHRHIKELEKALATLKDTFKKNDLLSRMNKLEQEGVKNDLLNRVIALESKITPPEGK